MHRTNIYRLAILLTAVALLVPVSALAQAQTCTGSAPKADSQSKDQKTDKKDTKNKKKDKKSGQDSTEKDVNVTFSKRTADDVLGLIRDGLEGHSRRTMLSAFDSDKMDGYLSFEDQIEAFFDRYNAFRVHFVIANVTIEGTKGIVLVDAEMEESPANGAAPVRKRTQLRMELEQGKKGWKVVDFRDRGFFN